jgi:hypothetical protein
MNSCVEIWNYNKMKLAASYSADFRINPSLRGQHEIRIERRNPWEEYMKTRLNE